MNTNICFAYPWATFGGCERIFINRAIAFKKYLPGVHVNFLFLSDAGGLTGFKSALKKYDLEDVASITTSLNKQYNLVSLVDCPQLFKTLQNKNQRYIVECHTGYVENRQYLSDLPTKCNIVATPSPRFRNLIRSEFPTLNASLIDLPNFVPWDIEDNKPANDIKLPKWVRKPILYLGRFDKLKDPITLLNAYQIIEKKRPGEFMLLLCGPKSNEIDIDAEIAKRGLGFATIVLPPIPFDAVPSLLHAVSNNGGIFVSPSHAESFGLSAAEAISALIPSVLSDIDAHRDLLESASNIFTFPVGDEAYLAKRIEYVFNNLSEFDETLRNLRQKFSAEYFIKSWNILLSQV